MAVHDKYNPKIIYDRFFRPGAVEEFNGQGNASYTSMINTLHELNKQGKWSQMNFRDIYTDEKKALTNDNYNRQYAPQMNEKAQALRARRR